VRQAAHVAVTAVDLLVVGDVAAAGRRLEPVVERRPVDHLHVVALVGREDDPQVAEARAGDGRRVDVGEAGVAAGLADPGVLRAARVGEGGVEGRGLLVLDLVHDLQERGARRQVLVAGDGVHAVAALDGADRGVLVLLQLGLHGAVLVEVLHGELHVVRQAHEGALGAELGLVDGRDELDAVLLAVEAEVGDRGGAEEAEDEAEVTGLGGEDDDLLGVHVDSCQQGYCWTWLGDHNASKLGLCLRHGRKSSARRLKCSKGLKT